MITINDHNVSVMAGVGGVVGGAVDLVTFAAVAGALTRGGASTLGTRQGDGESRTGEA